jgi:cellulose synthase/poly-beta-1,6-N-acetylglucosamine synthase-like glycosyltransferase
MSIGHLHDFVERIDWIVLVYFLVVNTFYLLLLVSAALEMRSYRARVRFEKRNRVLGSNLTPSLSVLAPAFNESATVAQSVRSLLLLHYADLEVVLVSDGSTDTTVDVLLQEFELTPVHPIYRKTIETAPVRAIYRSALHPGLIVVDKDNGGKADALNAALNVASGELVCAIDADTLIEPDALLLLARPFLTQPDVVATGGTIRVVNGCRVEEGRVTDVRVARRALPGIQVVEYLRAFLFGRLGWNRLGGNLIISGALGLFRREILLRAGGYLHGTVGEDIEIVARVRRTAAEHHQPSHVQFVPDPVAWTEVLSTFRSLGRQRDRWHRGLADVIWRYRRVIGNPRYGKLGLIAFPYFFVVELIAPIVEGFGLLALVLSFALGTIDSAFAIAFFVVVYFYGILLNIFAIALDEFTFRRYQRISDRLWLFLWAFVESFGYRQLTVLWRLKGIVNFLRRRTQWGTMTRKGFGVVIACILIVTTACTSEKTSVDASDTRYAGQIVQQGSMTLPAAIQGEHLALGFGDHFEARFWPGVNLGATTPGFSPGELSVTREEFDRWFEHMHELGVRVVRVYTIQRPHFYDALREFNEANPNAPLYVMHGVWVPEEELLSTGNAYDPAVRDGFRNELANAVAVVHGDITLPEQRGHASGRYTSDISPWLLAWSIGIEWDPTATAATNERNSGTQPFAGTYFTARPGSNPMESWIASMLDHTAQLEAARGWSRPMTFTNWLTTDPLQHPEEPLGTEDLVTIDAMNIAATAQWPGGFFASYHAYSYYPDFLRTQPSYATYERPRDGQVDPYAGYLNELKKHHQQQAVMITEFGIPTSIGSAHIGPTGRDQGGHSEADAARHIADMMRDIKDERFAGGIVFQWIDEWFKFTWNTIETELPSDRRQLWRNPLTNEEHFGIVAAEPGKKRPVTLDGKTKDWDTEGVERKSNNDKSFDLRVTHDAEFLYLLLDANDAERLSGLTVAFDVRPGSNKSVIDGKSVSPHADTRLRFQQDGNLAFEQAAWTDVFSWQYGIARNYVPVNEADLRQDSGAWVPLRQILNRPYTLANGTTLPVEFRALDVLRQGTTDPESPTYDNRNLAFLAEATAELRIPWSYLTYSDPSSHQVYVPNPDGTISSQTVDGLRVSIHDADATEIVSLSYDWENWNAIDWHERKKAGWPTLADVFTSVGTAP